MSLIVERGVQVVRMGGLSQVESICYGTICDDEMDGGFGSTITSSRAWNLESRIRIRSVVSSSNFRS